MSFEGILYSKPQTPETPKVAEHTIYMNEYVKFSIAKAGIPILVSGQTATGKTSSALIICSQTNCIYFDPQGFLKRKLRALKEDKNWDFWVITEEKRRKNVLKINASDLSPRVANIFAKSMKPTDRSALRTLDKFTHLPQAERTYALLQKMFSKKKLFAHWDDLKVILDEDDAGIDLEKFSSSGRHAVNISELTPQTFSIGILTETILGMRASTKWKLVPLIIACDESQSFLEKNTFVGRAFELLCTKGRIYKITPLVVGVSPSPIYKSIKNTFKIFVIHNVVYDRADYEMYGIDVNEYKLSQLPSTTGWCFFYYPEQKNTGGVLLRPNLFYQSLRNIDQEEVVAYKKENFGYLTR